MFVIIGALAASAFSVLIAASNLLLLRMLRQIASSFSRTGCKAAVRAAWAAAGIGGAGSGVAVSALAICWARLIFCLLTSIKTRSKDTEGIVETVRGPLR